MNPRGRCTTQWTASSSQLAALIGSSFVALALGCGADSGSGTVGDESPPPGPSEGSEVIASAPESTPTPASTAGDLQGPAPPARRCRQSRNPDLRVPITQADLDALAGCEIIEGALFIDAPDGVTLDLQPLASVRQVVGVVTLGCNPYFGTDSYCGPSDERAFTLAGLENLQSVGALTIGGLRVSSLDSLRALRTITTGELNIVNTSQLTSLTPLAGVANLSRVWLESVPSLMSLDGLNLAAALDRLEIDRAPALVDTAALARIVEANLIDLRGFPLETLDGLRNLTGLSSLYLVTLPSLRDITGINQLRSLGALHLDDTGLRNLDGLQLESVGQLGIRNNSRLTQVDSLAGLTQLFSVDVINNPVLERLPTFPNLTEVNIAVELNPELTTAPSFPNLVNSGSIGIANNPRLERILGFASVSSAGDIYIRQNAALVQIDLGSLQEAAALQITCNPLLPDASLSALSTVRGGERLLTGNQGSAEWCMPL